MQANGSFALHTQISSAPPSRLERRTHVESHWPPETVHGMKLAYLLSQYPALSHTFLFREVTGLRERGFDIRLCSINEPDRSRSSLPRDEAAEVDQTFYVKRTGGFSAMAQCTLESLRSPLHVVAGLLLVLRMAASGRIRLLRHLGYLTEAILVGRWMRRERVTHLHVHFGTAVSTVAWLVSKLFPVTYSMTIHGPDEFYDARALLLSEKVADARFVVCISEFARSQLMLLSDPAHWHKLVVRPLGVDPEEFCPKHAVAAAYPEPFRILCVARYAAAKGLDLLIGASTNLSLSQNRDLIVRIAGDGPERERLRQLSSVPGSPCDLVGPVPRTVVPDLLAASDAFVLPSFAEGVPISLMEAMACGVPVIATRIAGIPELIRDGVDGLLVAPGSVTELEAAISRLMDDPALRARLRIAGPRRIRERYNLPHNLDLLAQEFLVRVAGKEEEDHASARTGRDGDHRLVPDSGTDTTLPGNSIRQHG